MQLTSELLTALAKPFPPNEIRFKVQTSKNGSSLVVPYVDARAVMDRLDEVFGGDWYDDYSVVQVGKRVSIECSLTCAGVTRKDVGDIEDSQGGGDLKAGYSDALKRAAVKFGIGRFLYSLPKMWVKLSGDRIAPSDEQKLQEKVADILAGAKPEPEPKPEPKPSLKAQQLEACVADGTVENEYGFNGALKFSKVIDDTTPVNNVVFWFREYRKHKDNTKDTEMSAKFADDAYKLKMKTEAK